jgi:3-deoxy-D-manno-octulosonic-acid transferase
MALVHVGLRLVRWLYSLAIRCAAPLAFAVVLWRGLRDRSYRQGLSERFGYGSAAHTDEPAGSIWLHAVSLGEMTAAAPLIRALRTRYPLTPIVVTTATPAGRARAHALFGDTVDLRFLPYDTPGSVRRFFARTKPRLAVILETELWPNLFRQCDQERVPVLVANARLSPKSVARYQRLDRILGGLVRGVFSSGVQVAAQSLEDAERFQSIGAAAARTRVTGNIKFDLQLDADAPDRGKKLRATFGAARPVWIAGSTHAGEEEQLLTAHLALIGKLPGALLMLVPRHKERFAAVADLLRSRGVKFTRRRSGEAPPADVPVLLVDTVGELAALYASADIAFVGGSLVPIGGHNLLEPAALGLPVVTGPSQFNGQEVARLLLQRGAALQVANAVELTAVLRRLFEDAGERQRIGHLGQEIIAANRGSVEALLETIAPLLER